MEKVFNVVRKSPHRYIVITHGTYTMPDTARFLKAKLGKIEKTIVFTGSMIPIQGFAPSDGTFNLGFVLGKIEHLESGVHVAMNGRVFAPEEVLGRLNDFEVETFGTYARGTIVFVSDGETVRLKK